LGSRGANTAGAARDDSGREPLAEVAREFLECIASGRTPRSNGAAGLRAVELLEIASASLKDAGRALPASAKRRQPTR
jgi:hypothetical protein